MGAAITVAATKTTTITRTTSATSNLDTTGTNYALSTGLLDIATGGTLTANGSTITLTANGTPLTRNGTFTYGTSTIVYNHATSATITAMTGTGGSNGYYNLQTDGAGTYTLGGNTTINNNLTITQGTLDVDNTNNYSLTITGNYSNSGTFTARAGTVTLDGTNQTISGNSTFYNLTKTTSAEVTLTFESTKTQTITNTATLKGIQGNLLLLRSATNGTQWKIDPQGTRDIEFVDVKDSNNIHATAINCIGKNCTNSGNNTNWTFVAATDSEALSGNRGGGTALLISKILKPGKDLFEKILEEILKLRLRITDTEIVQEPSLLTRAPLALRGNWQLLPAKPIREFVLAPLPKNIRKLTEKFPELKNTFEQIGIVKITDVKKLQPIKLTLPGLTERLGLPSVKIEPGEFALPQGIPIAKLDPKIKENIPTEIVFVKTGDELIDFNIDLSVNQKGELNQKINTISDKLIQLAVKPDKPVKKIKGYVVFKSKKTVLRSEIPLRSLLASLVFAFPSFVQNHNPAEIENLLVLIEFEYTDEDNDGIYTAQIKTPVAEGEYEIITVMDYEDIKLGQKEIRLITVVDPEGYVFEKDKEREIRIPGAIISLHWFNIEKNQYEPWRSKEYQQENPQITDVTGKYSFLVPEGLYYLAVTAPGYLEYQGKPFEVSEGRGVHVNIELKTKYWWLKIINWQTLILIVVILLLFYNFYRDRIFKRRLLEANSRKI
ncbi:MAG: hypothetical protein AAB565_02225, partial [Patescibacteria group bacterium]